MNKHPYITGPGRTAIEKRKQIVSDALDPYVAKALHYIVVSYSNPAKTLNLYTKEFNGLNFYQINTKRNGELLDMLPTYVFDINVKFEDRLNVTIDYTEEKACTGLLKLVLLAPNGRVIRSVKKISDAIFHDLYAYERSKRNVNLKFNVVPGKYTMKYWAIACDDCYHTISVNSMNDIESVSGCGIRKYKK